MRLNKEALEANASLTEDEKSLIVKAISSASNHPGASNGEIVAYRFLTSLTPNGAVCLNDVLYHFGSKKVCALLQIQEKGHCISDFWSDSKTGVNLSFFQLSR